MDRNTRIRRLLYRSRSTGTKELDLWLSRFAEARLAGLGERELDEYERLLGEPHDSLWRFLSGTGPAPWDGPVARAMAAFRPHE